MTTLDTVVGGLYRLGARSPPGSRAWNRLRRALLPRLDGWTRRRYDRPLVRDKTGAGAERVGVLDAPVATVERALSEAGYRRNVPATLKYIDGAGDRQYERASWVRHAEPVQHHVYLFEAAAGVIVYAHRETSYLADPQGHEGHADDPHYAPGDPNGWLADAIAAAGLDAT